MRYIPHTDRDIQYMLEAVGVDSVADLFESIPSDLKLSRSLALPDPQDEESLSRTLSDLAQGSPGSADRMALFMGAGAYAHHIPAAVGQMLLRGEFLTAYTPYQPECSQGTLQAIFEYQSMLAALTGCEVVNASMYDGATAAAEAVLMALRVKRKRKRTLISQAVHPEVSDVCRTYLSERDPGPETLPFADDGRTDLSALEQALDNQVACLLVQQPNFLGCLEDLPTIARLTHDAGALLLVVVLEPVSLGMIEAPAALGADLVCGEGMSLGSGLNFGGPGLGIFGASKKHVWQMPGRLVGQTTDTRGQTGYVLTMSTREQHIRRARATSNICTNEGLCALAAAIHLSLLGKQGFGELARSNAANARAALALLGQAPGVSPAFGAPFFNEFALRIEGGPPAVQAALARLSDRNILGGLPLGRFYPELNDCLLVCVTELNSLEEIERYARVLEGEAPR